MSHQVLFRSPVVCHGSVHHSFVSHRITPIVGAHEAIWNLAKPPVSLDLLLSAMVLYINHLSAIASLRLSEYMEWRDSCLGTGQPRAWNKSFTLYTPFRAKMPNVPFRRLRMALALCFTMACLRKQIWNPSQQKMR